MDKNKALKLALKALEKISRTQYHIETPPIESLEEQMRRIADKAITAIKQARNLDKMAENARELGLDYDPAGGTQVSKVWWDGEKMMTKPIPLEDVYQPAPMQEPEIVQRVNTSTDYDSVGFPIYITPPATQRPWVGLTDEDIMDVIHPLVMADMPDEVTDYEICRAIEAKLKEKNT